MIYFVLFVALEAILISFVSSVVGFWSVFAEMVISGIIGGWILKNFQLTFLWNLTKMSQQKMGMEQFVQANVASAIGAFLLILPGVMTDFIGLAFQSNFIATLFFKIFYKQSHYNTHYQGHYTTQGEKDEIIDAEIIDSTNILDNR